MNTATGADRRSINSSPKKLKYSETTSLAPTGSISFNIPETKKTRPVTEAAMRLSLLWTSVI